jgi:hypothetical protein
MRLFPAALDRSAWVGSPRFPFSNTVENSLGGGALGGPGGVMWRAGRGSQT